MTTKVYYFIINVFSKYLFNLHIYSIKSQQLKAEMTTTMQSQKAVTAYFKSKHLLPWTLCSRVLTLCNNDFIAMEAIFRHLVESSFTSLLHSGMKKKLALSDKIFWKNTCIILNNKITY